MTPHGTVSRYWHQKCRCTPCREAANAHVADWRLGRHDHLIDATPTRERIQQLRGIGYRLTDIATAAGLHWHTIQRIAAGQARTSTSTAAAVTRAAHTLTT